MSRTHSNATGRSVLFMIAAMVCMAFCAGCVCTDYGFEYRLHLQVKDKSGSPIPNAKLFAHADADSHPDQWDPYSPAFVRSNLGGHATPVAHTGIAWGECTPFPWWSKPPVPKNPRVLFLWIQTPSRGWTPYELTIKDDQIIQRSHGALDIDYGPVTAAWP